jgi:hypothetical protein
MGPANPADLQQTARSIDRVIAAAEQAGVDQPQSNRIGVGLADFEINGQERTGSVECPRAAAYPSTLP